MSIYRKPFPFDVSAEEWSLVAPYRLLQREDAGQREHDLREMFNGLRYMVKTGAPWQWVPNDLPPWAAVSRQMQRWPAAGCFEALVNDLRAGAAAGGGAQGRADRCDPSIRWAIYWHSMSRRPARKTAVRWSASHVPCRPSPTTPSNDWVDLGYIGERAANAAARHCTVGDRTYIMTASLITFGKELK